jgi:hypothetical protein
MEANTGYIYVSITVVSQRLKTWSLTSRCPQKQMFINLAGCYAATAEQVYRHQIQPMLMFPLLIVI